MEEEGYEEFMKAVSEIEYGTPIYDFGMESLDITEPDPNDGIARFSDGHDALGILVAIAVAPVWWYWAAIQLQSLRARKEMNTAMARILMVERVGKIFPQEGEAEAMVDRTLAAIAKRDKDDPVLKGILESAEKIIDVVNAVKGTPGKPAKGRKKKEVEKPADRKRIAP